MNDIFENEYLTPGQILRDSVRVAATSKLRDACDQFAAAMGDSAAVLGRDDAHTLAVSFLSRDLGSARGLGVGPREGERVAVKLFGIKRQEVDDDE